MIKFINNILKNFLLLLIRFYKIAISPMLGQNCKHYPSCSEYAHEALLLYNPFRAIYLILHRISRCHPFSKGGYDPVKGKSSGS